MADIQSDSIRERLYLPSANHLRAIIVISMVRWLLEIHIYLNNRIIYNIAIIIK